MSDQYPPPVVTWKVPDGPLKGTVHLEFSVTSDTAIDGANIYVSIDGKQIGWAGSAGFDPNPAGRTGRVVVDWDSTSVRDGEHRLTGVVWWIQYHGGPRILMPAFDLAIVTSNGASAGPPDPVRVPPPAGPTPHLSRGGAVIGEYDPDRSVIPRAIFFLGTDQIIQSPGLVDVAKAAGINTLDQGLYSVVNPEYDDATPDLWARYERNASAIYDSSIQNCKYYGFLLWAGGDNLAYDADHIARATTHAFAPRALALFNQRLRDSGLCVGVEMLDESGRFDHDSIQPYVALKAALDATPHVPVAWPIFSLADGNAAEAFDPLQEYRSLQCTPSYWADIPEGFSVTYWRQILEDGLVGRVKGLPGKATVFSNPSICARIGDFDPNPPERITFQILGALCLGIVGFRSYLFDDHGGGGDGPNPLTNHNKDRWDALSAAYRFIASIEGYVLGPRIAPTFEPGAEFLIGCWEGVDSSLVQIVHGSDRPLATPRGRPSDYGRDLQIVVEIRCFGGELTIRRAGDRHPALRPGESLAYVFARPGTAEYMEALKMIPTPDSTAVDQMKAAIDAALADLSARDQKASASATAAAAAKQAADDAQAAASKADASVADAMAKVNAVFSPAQPDPNKVA